MPNPAAATFTEARAGPSPIASISEAMSGFASMERPYCSTPQ